MELVRAYLTQEGELRDVEEGARVLEEDVRFESVREAEEYCEREGYRVEVEYSLLSEEN